MMHLLLILAVVFLAIAVACAMRKDWSAAAIMAVLGLLVAAFSGVPLTST